MLFNTICISLKQFVFLDIVCVPIFIWKVHVLEFHESYSGYRSFVQGLTLDIGLLHFYIDGYCIVFIAWNKVNCVVFVGTCATAESTEADDRAAEATGWKARPPPPLPQDPQDWTTQKTPPQEEEIQTEKFWGWKWQWL